MAAFQGGYGGGRGRTGPPGQSHASIPPDGEIIRAEQSGTGLMVDRQAISASVSAGAAEEIRVAAQLAVHRPRSEEAARQRILQLCEKKAFAEAAAYRYPRGNTTVTGCSVVLARELARLWGNIRDGVKIIADDEDTRSIVGWAWDVENNSYEECPDTFRKVIQRKNPKTGVTQWVTADERELRELTNRRGAICVRNAVLHLMPFDLKEEIGERASATMRAEVEKDPDAAKRQVIDGFSRIGVPADELEAYIGHDLGGLSPAEVEKLRGIYRSVNDGEAAWADFYRAEKPTVKADAKTMEAFGGASARSEERPGSAPDDRLPTLPTSLRPDKGDHRTIAEFLLDAIPFLDESDLDKIVAALPGLQREKQIKAKDMQTIVMDIGKARASLRGEEEEETAEDGAVADSATTPGEDLPGNPFADGKIVDPAAPPIVREIEGKMSAARGEMVVQMLQKQWAEALEKDPALDAWNEAIGNVAARCLEKIAETKKNAPPNGAKRRS
jgi:hypothetical protein